jgi:hypothetical protein
MVFIITGAVILALSKEAKKLPIIDSNPSGEEEGINENNVYEGFSQDTLVILAVALALGQGVLLAISGLLVREVNNRY